MPPELPTRLRIAVALPGLHRVTRGAETAFTQIARQLARLGHEVTVFGSGPARPGEPYRFCHVPCVAREIFENWPTFPALRTHYAWEELTFGAGLIRRYRGDDFDISLACSYPFMNWILRRGQARHVFVTQNGDWMVHSHDAEYRYFDCDGLVCTNPEYFSTSSGRFPTVLIPNGVDPEIFKPGPADRSAFGLPPSGPLALMVSALIPSKRVVEGIRAAAKVPGLFLAVAGDGECRNQVDEEARRLLPGQFKRVSLSPEKMPDLYRCADCLLHMSRDEPSAMAYTEALATGLPIVTHDWNVTRWTLPDHDLLVDSTDENAVAAALARAIEDKSPQRIENRRQCVNQRFSWSRIGEQYSQFLLQLCGESAPVAPTEESFSDVGVVAIGRNEGERLVRCLRSVRNKAAAVVYVDSASDDQSVESAKNLGAQVVELKKNAPFTAALARNLGRQRLMEIAPNLKYIQFVDGDCEVRPDWIAKARRTLESDGGIAAVCGRRRERFPRRSIYNRLIDIEWNTPIGPALAVGGDAMFRAAAFDAALGYDPSVMAGEEPQLCLRLRHSHWTILRIEAEMTIHDAAMTRFGQWWRRHVRAGYGTLDVNRRFEVGGERIFGKMVRSATIWALGWPLAVFAAAMIAGLIRGKTAAMLAALIVFAALPMQMIRIALRAFLQGTPPPTALMLGIMTMLSKWAWFQGQLKYRLDRRRGRGLQLIEYKRENNDTAPVIPI